MNAATANARKEWMDAGEAAAHLGIERRTVNAWAKAGKLPSHPLPGGSKRQHRRFLLEELDATLCQPPASPEKGMRQ